MDHPDHRMTARLGGGPVTKGPRCDFCGAGLTAVQEFTYHVESFNFLDDPVALEILRRRPTYHGEPLRLCGACRASIEANVRDREAEGAAAARVGGLVWRLTFWLLILPLGLRSGLLFALAAVAEVVKTFR